MKKNKPMEFTHEAVREAMKSALGMELTDEKTLEKLTDRGMVSPKEKLTVGEAIVRLRLLTELDAPTPGGFEKLTKELCPDGSDGDGDSAVIEIRAPEEYLG